MPATRAPSRSAVIRSPWLGARSAPWPPLLCPIAPSHVTQSIDVVYGAAAPVGTQRVANPYPDHSHFVNSGDAAHICGGTKNDGVRLSQLHHYRFIVPPAVDDVLRLDFYQTGVRSGNRRGTSCYRLRQSTGVSATRLIDDGNSSHKPLLWWKRPIEVRSPFCLT